MVFLNILNVICKFLIHISCKISCSKMFSIQKLHDSGLTASSGRGRGVIKIVRKEEGAPRAKFGSQGVHVVR